MSGYGKYKRVPAIILLTVMFLICVSCRESVKDNPVRGGKESAVDAPGHNDKSPAEGNQADSVKSVHAGSSIKEIKGSRPDMSKVKSSPSTTVERPTGSKYPSGTGKPKGSSKSVTKKQSSR